MIHFLLFACSTMLPIASPAASGPSLLASATSPCDTERSAPQDPATLKAILVARQFMLAMGIEPEDLANNLHQLVINHNVWPMWTCTYADGTVVYNKFRWYRDVQKVTEYFLGNPDRHDRDAYYFVGNRCYRWDTRCAAQFAQQHGGIVDITSIE